MAMVPPRDPISPSTQLEKLSLTGCRLSVLGAGTGAELDWTVGMGLSLGEKHRALTKAVDHAARNGEGKLGTMRQRRELPLCGSRHEGE
jgi:hypothetical protein